MSQKTPAVRVFGFTDIHWSERDERALEIAKAAQRQFKPDITVIGGDLLNCTAFSRHPKRILDEDDTYDYTTGELDPAAKFLDEVQANTERETVMLAGNHDEWFERWIRNTEGGLAFRSQLPSRYFPKGRENFKYISFSPRQDNRNCYYKLKNDVIVTHGWCAPKYAAQHHLDKARDVSVIFHHTHRFDHRAGTLFRDKRVIEAFSAGCLCKQVPMYAHNGAPTDWVLGFWVAFIGKRSWTGYPIPIKRYEAVLPDGTQIKG